MVGQSPLHLLPIEEARSRVDAAIDTRPTLRDFTFQTHFIFRAWGVDRDARPPNGAIAGGGGLVGDRPAFVDGAAFANRHLRFLEETKGLPARR